MYGINNVVEFCDFSGTIVSEGIMPGGHNTEFRYNKVHDIIAGGDGVLRLPGERSNMIIRNNVFYNNSNSRLIFLYRAYNTKVIDNLVYDSVGAGGGHWNILHAERTYGSVVRGNTFVCNDPDAAALSFRSYGNTVEDNIIINCIGEGAIRFFGGVHPLYMSGGANVPFCCDELSHENPFGDCSTAATCTPTEFQNKISDNYFPRLQ